MVAHTPPVVTRATCRLCGAGGLTDLFTLGEQFVSDFVPADKVTAGVRCPIDLTLCASCSLVQLRHTAPQELLYRRHYWYTSGTTATMRAALRDVAAAVERVARLRPGDVVLDIGSNDGTFLRSYETPGLYKVGVEPAVNLADVGHRGLECYVSDFWPLVGGGGAFPAAVGPARAVTALGMLYDADDPNPFVAGVAKALAPDGVFVAQIMCLRQTVALADVGNFAHEHLLYFSLKSLERLYAAHGLELFDVEENAVNGGSYRLWARHKGAGFPSATGGRLRVAEAKMREYGMGLDSPEAYRRLYDRMAANREACVAFLRGERARGKRAWVLGASTKGNVIAQFYSLTPDLVEAAADRSPEKHGLHMVGTGIPVRSEEEFRAANPDHALILPYAFADEITARESDWRSRGGRFVIPLPEFRVV